MLKYLCYDKIGCRIIRRKPCDVMAAHVVLLVSRTGPAGSSVGCHGGMVAWWDILT